MFNRINEIDLLILAAIIAALFWNIIAVYLQKKWRVFIVFAGKKHALKIQAGLVTLVWLQVAVVVYFDRYSTWSFKSMWYLGVPLLAFSIWLLFNAIKELGFGPLINSNLFNYKVKTHGPIYKRYKHPMYIGFTAGLFGLGLCVGKYGILLAAILLGIGLLALTKIEAPPEKPHAHTD